MAGKSACERPGGERHAKATREGAPTGVFNTDCGRGEFLDIGKGHCYSCPDGYNRSAAPVTASTACIRKDWGLGRRIFF